MRYYFRYFFLLFASLVVYNAAMVIKRPLLLVLIFATVFIFSAAILVKITCEASEVTDHFIFQRNSASEYGGLPENSIQTDKILSCDGAGAITLESIILYLEKQKNSPPGFSCHC